MIENDVVNEFRLALGTMAHAWLEDKFRSAPVMNEVKLDAWMPEGWTGTADALFWNADLKAFTLVDYKTCKPSAIPYIHKDGIKDGHLWQASVYWHAAREMGIPLIHGFGIFYLPIEQLKASEGFVQPTFQEATPLPWEVVEPVMLERWAATKKYLEEVEAAKQVWENQTGQPWQHVPEDGMLYLTPSLAPVQERVAKTYINKQLKRPVIDVKLCPHWSTAFCPFDDSLCNCRQQGTNKVGHWTITDADTLAWVPSKDTDPSWDPPVPEQSQINALASAIAAL